MARRLATVVRRRENLATPHNGRVYDGSKLDFVTLENCPCPLTDKQLLAMGHSAACYPLPPRDMRGYEHMPSYAPNYNTLLNCGHRLICNFMDSQCGGQVVRAPFALLCMYVGQDCRLQEVPTSPFTGCVVPYQPEHWGFVWPEDYGAKVKTADNGWVNTWPQEWLLTHMGYEAAGESVTYESGFAFAIAAACSHLGA